MCSRSSAHIGGMADLFLASCFATWLLSLFKIKLRAFCATCPLWSTNGSMDYMGTSNLVGIFFKNTKERKIKLKLMIIRKSGKEGWVLGQWKVVDSASGTDTGGIEASLIGTERWQEEWRRRRILFWERTWRKGEKSLCWEEREPAAPKQNVGGFQKQTLQKATKRWRRTLGGRAQEERWGGYPGVVGSSVPLELL